MATIEIDGKQLEADAGEMIIEVADREGIHIPRFCYHKKLSVAANCRMCLVDVEKAPKALPACATPVTDGMKVLTQSSKAIAAQKAVMAFLLINHPLDCPICDQGGECELQDVSMGYGGDVSRFTEGKRVVHDEDLGSLIATDMTRCIHCTRCVRFGEEVAGFRELGATGRGAETRIGTFVESNLKSEVSGNIIDLCPVGALTSKPYRFSARAWELQQHNSIAPHDCLGSNIHVHTRRQAVKRVVPMENEAINETWLSDRARFSYTALSSEQRLAQPMVKEDGEWQVVDWETALQVVAKRVGAVVNSVGAEKIGAIIHPSATLEEMFLLQKMMRGMGSPHIDYRLAESDFSDQESMPLYPGMTSQYAAIEKADTVFLIGSNIQREQPLAALRLRKATLQGGHVHVLQMMDFAFHFDVTHRMLASVKHFASQLAEIAKVFESEATPDLKTLLAEVNISETARQIATALKNSEHGYVILGALAMHHPQAGLIRSLARFISDVSGTELIMMTAGSNTAGAWLAGAIPHRHALGHAAENPGYSVQQMFQEKLKAYFLFAVEPEIDAYDPELAIQALKQAETVIACTQFQSDAMLDYADVILPIAAFTETSGTYINVEGTSQSFNGAVKPPGEARPGWKVLRVLGNTLHLDGFDYMASTDVRDTLLNALPVNDAKRLSYHWPEQLVVLEGFQRIGPMAMYAIDPIVRHAGPLQDAAGNDDAVILVNETMAKHYNLRNGKHAIAIQNGNETDLVVRIDNRVADDSIYLVNGLPRTTALGPAFGKIELK